MEVSILSLGLGYGSSRELSGGFELYRDERSDVNGSNVTTANSTTDECNKLVDDSDLKDGRIPHVLGISIALWLALMCVFFIIRYCATEYSRVGLVTTSRWAKAVYNRQSGATLLGKSDDRQTLLENEDKYWYTWIVRFFKLRDSEIRMRCGPDASLYLALHRYLIVLLCVFTFLSLVIVLPVNYSSGDREADGGFTRTTIANIGAKSDALWLHTTFSFLYLCITMAFMVHYSVRLGRFQQMLSGYTVMIEWIPKVVHREDLMHHFQEAMPNACVVDIQLVYDVAKVMRLSEEMHEVKQRLESVESMKQELGMLETVHVGWRRWLCFFSDKHKVDANSYYQHRLCELREAINQEMVKVRDKRLSIGFVTFAAKEHAKSFYLSYKLCRCQRHPHSNMDGSIRAQFWGVSMAPYPLDILWDNLSVPYIVWWTKWLLINLTLFVFLFFFTTPSIVLAGIDEIRVHFTKTSDDEDADYGVDPLVKTYVSSILLLVVASLMPYCVAKSCYIEGHWTKSSRQLAIMRKTFGFLLIMVVLLPSIGLASLSAVGELALRGEESVKDRLQCAYLPNNGAFFVAYVITVTFVGTAVELLRMPELVCYVYRRLLAKTSQQRQQALRKASQYDFMYGVQYAWILVTFTMVVTFSLSTPVIVPFGMLYFVMKYYTDKYNIYYVYRPASFNGRQFLHQTAIIFVISGAVVLQFSTLFFSVLRLGKLDPRTILMIIVIVVVFMFFLGLKVIGLFSHLLPLLMNKLGKDYRVFYTRRGDVQEEMEDETLQKGTYIAPVLQEESVEVGFNESGAGYQSFGSTDNMGRHSPRSGHSTSTSPRSQSPTVLPIADSSKTSVLRQEQKRPEATSSAGEYTGIINAAQLQEQVET